MAIHLNFEVHGSTVPSVVKQLQDIPDHTMVIVSRVLVYHGTAKWMRDTLGQPHAAIQGVGPSRMSPFPNGATLECQAEELEVLTLTGRLPSEPAIQDIPSPSKGTYNA